MFPQTINAMYQFYENEIGKINGRIIKTLWDFLYSELYGY